jgi:hypothetical protein
MGLVAQAVYQAIDDPNDITALHDFATREQAEAFTPDMLLSLPMLALARRSLRARAEPAGRQSAERGLGPVFRTR